jgi:hypothetical protein
MGHIYRGSRVPRYHRHHPLFVGLSVSSRSSNCAAREERPQEAFSVRQAGIPGMGEKIVLAAF